MYAKGGFERRAEVDAMIITILPAPILHQFKELARILLLAGEQIRLPKVIDKLKARDLPDDL
jgi:hypothetical protein